MKSAKRVSESYEDIRADHTPTNGRTNRLGRRLGNASMFVAVFGTDFQENDGAYVTMTQARDLVSGMHQSVQRLAQRIGYSLSLAQLRADSTPLGPHVMQSPDLPLQI